MSKQIRFDRSLYLPEAVEAAASAYSGHAKFEIAIADDAIEAVMSDIAGDDPEFVANAFCNHVLHETIGRKRQSVLQEIA